MEMPRRPSTRIRPWAFLLVLLSWSGCDSPSAPPRSPASPAKALTSFHLVAPDVAGTVDESSHTVTLTVPPAGDLTALVATFTTTGATVKVGGILQVSGVTPNDFTEPVTYTVTAADGSAQDYVVTLGIRYSARILHSTPSYHTVVDGSTILDSGRFEGVWASTDSGATWAQVSTGYASSAALVGASTVCLLPGADPVGTTDGGTTWNAIHVPFMTSDLVTDGSTLYAFYNASRYDQTPAYAHGFWFSADGGAHWTTVSTADGLASNQVSDLVVHGSQICVAGFWGLALTSDAGAHWRRIPDYSPEELAQIAAGGPVTIASPGREVIGTEAVAVAGSTLYTAGMNRIHRSTDGGSTWVPIPAEDAGVSPPYSLAASGRLVCLGTAAGLFLSVNAGATWNKVTTSEGLASNEVSHLCLVGNILYCSTTGGLCVISL